MKQQKEEKESTGNCPGQIKPIPRVSILSNVESCLTRYYDAVNRMIDQRKKYPEYLNEKQIGHVMDVLYMLVEHRRSTHCGRISVNVNEVKNAQRNDACDLVQLSQNESVAKTYRHLNSVVVSYTDRLYRINCV